MKPLMFGVGLKVDAEIFTHFFTPESKGVNALPSLLSHIVLYE